MSTFCASLAGVLLNAVWKGALLSLAVAVVLRLLPVTTAALRSVVWKAVFLLLVWLHFAPSAAGAGTYHAATAWSAGVLAVWLVASACRAAQLVLSLRRVHSLCRRSTPVVEAAAVPGRKALLCTSNEVCRPTVAGLLRPRILIPEVLYDTLTPVELNYILLHEMTHVRRGDHWTNLLQKVVLVFFPLNPALLWTERRLCREREFACDERVIAATHSARLYALCLTSLAERSMFGRSSSLVLGAWHRRSELADRVQAMLSGPSRKATRLQTAALGGALCMGLVAAGQVLSRWPQLLSFAAIQTAPTVALDAAPPIVGGKMMLTSLISTGSRRHEYGGAHVHPGLLQRAVRPVAERQRICLTRIICRTHRTHRRTSTISLRKSGFRQAFAGHVPSSFVPEFVPVMAYAVATPDGWVLITL